MPVSIIACVLDGLGFVSCPDHLYHAWIMAAGPCDFYMFYLIYFNQCILLPFLFVCNNDSWPRISCIPLQLRRRGSISLRD